jgi:hypothetical protein
MVIAAPLASDQPAPKGDELAVRLAALVAGRIGGTARAHAQTAQLGSARSLSQRAAGLVFVQAEIAKGMLRVTADLYPPMSNAWDRIRNPVPSPKGHAFGQTRVDAEVRAFLAPVLLEQATVHKVRHEEGDVLAVACGDLDGDDALEIALVSRAKITLARARGGKLVSLASTPWSAAAPRAPVPMREPLGGAAIVRGRLLAGTTDRGGVSLAPDLSRPIVLPGLPFGDGLCVLPVPGAGAFEGSIVDCTSKAEKLAAPAPRYDAIAHATVLSPAGKAQAVIAAREPNGKLRVRLGEVQTRVFEGVGAQVAVGDLDQDGAPEIVTTSDTGEDALVITSWPGGADARQRLRVAAPAGVRALCTCPPEENGVPALVAVVGSEVWLVR